MICLFITIVFLVLRYFNVINWSYWVVFLPLMIEAAFATWILVKTEVVYMIDYNRKLKVEKEDESRAIN